MYFPDVSAHLYQSLILWWGKMQTCMSHIAMHYFFHRRQHSFVGQDTQCALLQIDSKRNRIKGNVKDYTCSVFTDNYRGIVQNLQNERVSQTQLYFTARRQEATVGQHVQLRAHTKREVKKYSDSSHQYQSNIVIFRWHKAHNKQF